MRPSNRFVCMALFLATMAVAASISEEAEAKPYACGKETCATKTKDKQICKACSTPVCEKREGKEYLVGSQTTWSDCKPARGGGALSPGVTPPVAPGQYQSAPSPTKTPPTKPPTTGGTSAGPKGGVGGVTAPPPLGSAPPPAAVVTPPTFYVVSYGGKCLDFGAPPQVSGAPVFIYGCNGTIAQQIQVQEINDRHEVILRAGTKVIGVKGSTMPTVSYGGTAPMGNILAAPPQPEVPLELQDEKRLTVSSLGQIFALDGDSIILASDRTRVVKVLNNRGTNRTPLVLGRRDLADAEFWTFVAADKSNRKPTSGFVRVPQEKDLGTAISNAHWGTVIEVDPSAPPINLGAYPQTSLQILDGVTIRGNRRGTLQGPELYVPDFQRKWNLEVKGDYVRITGLRLRGPNFPARSFDELPYVNGILVHNYLISNGVSRQLHEVIIDHNDMSDWTDAAVGVIRDEFGPPNFTCHQVNEARPQNIRVERNFLHHNVRQGGGYGVAMGTDGYAASVVGNTFLKNRHAITADGTARSGYSAWFNLVLSDTPAYHICCVYEQDFDMHGSDTSSHHTGGTGGGAVEIARNTFLGTNRRNFDLRGKPCHLDQFHDNVSRQNKNDAIRWVVQGSDQASPPQPPPPWLHIPNNNQFGPSYSDPTQHLGVGDFDGDGRDDVFLATGAAWYYAPAGNAEWRFLNAQTEQIGSLLFGDFDGDGRTDVFTQRGRDWLVSWGGASPWEKINESNPALSEFRIGDFDGDRRADVFYADGQRWWVSYGGVGPFIHTQDSGFRVADLGFGDFNGDGKTDVVGVVSGQWMVSLSATGSWAGFPLRAALTKTMAGLIIADFNGNGRADIATLDGKVSYDGRGDWTPLRTNPGTAAIGRFDNRPGADVLYWDSRSLRIVSSGVGPDQQQSRQDMR